MNGMWAKSGPKHPVYNSRSHAPNLQLEVPGAGELPMSVRVSFQGEPAEVQLTWSPSPRFFTHWPSASSFFLGVRTFAGSGMTKLKALVKLAGAD